MPAHITLEVFRYRPENETEPVYQSYEVPLRKDWVILDALNYIKDHLDGTLSFRWSCRMGVCGSCGMMVNDTPVLTCATFLEAYQPGPIRVAPMEHFPVVRDLVVEMSDFMEKLQRVKPWIIREEEKPGLGGGIQTVSCRTGRVQAIQYVYQLYALLCSLSGIWPGTGFYRPRCHRHGPTLQF